MQKLSIIIPVYYNQETLLDVYADLKSVVFPNVPAYELILVDDGSVDQSWEIMEEIARQDVNVRLIKLSRNFGSHAAMYAGLSVCTGDCATVKMADGQEPPELILDMLSSWQSGNRVVLAVRSDREEGFFQKAFANFYYWLVRKTALPSMPRGGFDCYLIDRKVIEVLKLMDEVNSTLTLQVLWVGFKRGIVYYTRMRRKAGKSRWTLSKKIKMVIDSVISFSFIPIRFATITGIIFFFIAFFWSIAVLIAKLTNQIVVPGYTTLIIILLFSMGMILLVLGILGEYIWRAVEASRKRPVFIIDEIVDKEGNDK